MRTAKWLFALSVAICSLVFASQADGATQPGSNSGCPSTACTAVLKAVAAATHIEQVPPNLNPSLETAEQDLLGPTGGTCHQLVSTVSKNYQACIYGSGTEKVALLGDSHGLMWSTAFAQQASQLGFQFGLTYRSGCFITSKDAALPEHGVQGAVPTGAQCQQWVNAAVAWLKVFNPQVMVVTEADSINAAPYESIFDSGFRGLLAELKAPGRRIVVLGDLPVLQQDGPICLAAHESNAKACSSPASVAVKGYGQRDEAAAAAAVGAPYINVIPWLCTKTTCPAVIGNYEVYEDQFHLTATFADSLGPVLSKALGMR